jgi:hypothetical protein
MDTKYNTRFAVTLTGTGGPVITYGIDDAVCNTIPINGSVILHFSLDLTTTAHKFFFEFANKTNDTPDMMVVVESVAVEGITTDRLKWSGIYTPNYPRPWADAQSNLDQTLPGATHLGWNGRWELPFTVPIFTWLHQKEHLGWIYS